MKIAILYSHLRETGGAERIVEKQADLLHELGHETACYFAYVNEQKLRRKINGHQNFSYFSSLPIPNIETLRVASSLPFAPLISKVFKNTDLLICHGYGPASWIGYITNLIYGTDYINYVHSIPRFLYLEPDERILWKQDPTREKLFILGQLFKPFLKKIDKLGLVNSRKILANSHYTAKRIKEIYGCETSICYPFVDLDLFKPIDKSAIMHETYRKYNLSKPLLVSTGRIAPLRRTDWLIDVIKNITTIFPSAILAITGEISQNNVEYVRKMKKKALSFGVENNVKFLGFVSDFELVKLLNVADAYVHACPHEAFGLSPVEAMACGTPAVVWDDGAGPSETVVDGKSGSKAKPYEIEDFATKTMVAINIDRTEVCDFATNFVRENFSPKKHLEILEKALGEA